MNWLVAGILLIQVVFLVFIVLFALILRGIYKNAVAFITPIEEGKQSPLGQVVSSLIDAAAKQVLIEFKTMFMGKVSAQSRQEQAAANDIMTGLVQNENPMIAGVLQSFPTLRKMALKNPGILEFAMSKLASKQKPPEANHGSGGGFAENAGKYGG